MGAECGAQETQATTFGLVTRAVPTKSDEAWRPEAQAAVRKELGNIKRQGVFDPSRAYDWAAVRREGPAATIGSGIMILGCKN